MWVISTIMQKNYKGGEEKKVLQDFKEGRIYNENKTMSDKSTMGKKEKQSGL